MAIVLGQGGAEDDQVKGIAAQGFLNTMAVERGGHVMSGLFHFGGLGGKCVFVAFTIKNLNRRFLRGPGQGPSWNSLGAYQLASILQRSRKIRAGRGDYLVTKRPARFSGSICREVFGCTCRSLRHATTPIPPRAAW